MNRPIAIPFGTEKLEWRGYQTVKIFWWYVYSFWHDPRTWQTHGQTDRQSDTAWRHRPRLHSIARQNQYWQELISRLDSRTLPLEPRHRCTSTVLSTWLRNNVLASCLLTKHVTPDHGPDDVIVTHAVLYDLSIGPIFNDLVRLDFKVALRRWI